MDYYDFEDIFDPDSLFDMFMPSMIQNQIIVSVVCAVLALIGGIVLYFTFLSKSNENKFSGFLGWLYDFLSFKKYFSEVLLKILYLIFASWITLNSIGTLLFTEYGSIGSRLLGFLLTITVGNIALRLIYEFMLVILVICRNTTEMNKKMGPLNEAYDQRQQRQPKAPKNQQTVQPQYQPSYQPPVQPQQYQNYYQEPVQAQAEPVAQPDVVFCGYCGAQFYSNLANCPTCGSARE